MPETLIIQSKILRVNFIKDKYSRLIIAFRKNRSYNGNDSRRIQVTRCDIIAKCSVQRVLFNNS